MIEIKLTGLGGGHVALVDKGDIGLVSSNKWYAARRKNKVYACTNVRPPQVIRPTIIYMHRLIRPDLNMIDHEDGNGLNNQRSNLRTTTHVTNGQNSDRRLTSPWPHKGVRCRPDKGRKSGRSWQARIVVRGREHSLGYFLTSDDAGRAYDAAAKKLFGEFARPNYKDNVSQ